MVDCPFFGGGDLFISIFIVWYSFYIRCSLYLVVVPSQHETVAMADLALHGTLSIIRWYICIRH